MVTTEQDTPSTAATPTALDSSTTSQSLPSPQNSRPAKGKRGRATDLSSEEIVILLREILAAGAHVAPHGAKAEYFETVALAFNGNGDFGVQVEGKSVRDRYERLQKAFNKRDREDAAMSGIGGKVGEVDELLGQMREAREEQNAQRNAKRAVIKEREQKKLAAEAPVVAKATMHGTNGNRGDAEISDGEGRSDRQQKQ